jgi:hypothetical protein
MNDQKTKFGTLALTLSMVLMFTAINAVGVIQAQPAATGTGAPEGQVPDEQAESACTDAMGKFADYELGKFREFITQNFQNKSSTSSLLENGFGRYKEFRTLLYDKYYAFYPQQGAYQLTEGIGSNACMSVVNDFLMKARNELNARAVQTSTVKKATAMIQKYQQINSKLATLNRTFLTMKSYLDTFADKLPCYIIKSCNKG